MRSTNKLEFIFISVLTNHFVDNNDSIVLKIFHSLKCNCINFENEYVSSRYQLILKACLIPEMFI